MDSPAKKLNLSLKDEEIEFVDIYDDCMFAIFELLPLSDLCSLSFTCQRMKNLTFDHFIRKYSNNQITIETMAITHQFTDSTGMKLSAADEKSLKYFNKCYRNVRIFSPKRFLTSIFLYNLLKSECHPELSAMELELLSIVDLNMQPDDDMKDQLKNIETVKIVKVDCARNIYNSLLVHCTNLKVLEISASNFNNVEWIKHDFPMLESLILPLIPTVDQEFVAQFFKRHQTLKDITCTGYYISKAAIEFLHNIERFAACIYLSDHLGALIKDFQNYNGNRSIKWFGLECGPLLDPFKRTFIDLNAIQPIHKLHLDGIKRSIQLPYLQYLKDFKLTISPAGLTDLKVIPQNAPNLMNLEMGILFFVDEIRDLGEILFKDILMSLVCDLLKLKNIKLELYDYEINYIVFNPNDLIDVESRRMSMSKGDASNLELQIVIHSAQWQQVEILSGKTMTITFHHPSA